MGELLFCQVGHLGFCLIILLALSLCYGNHVSVNAECAHCIPVGVTPSEASTGTGSIDCRSTEGDLRRFGAGEVDDRGNFKIKFLQDKNHRDQAERGSGFLKLDGASGAPCPGQEVQNVLFLISNSIYNVKQTSGLTRKLKFSPIRCTSKIPWPSDKKNKQLIDIPLSPGKSFEYPHQPSVKAFLSPTSGLMEIFPASVKKNSKPFSSLMSRKLLSLPVHFFEPVFPPLPVSQYPSPELAPPVASPPPTLILAIKKPLPPPTPISSNYKSSPAPTAIYPKLLPPPAPILKKPVLAPQPVAAMPSVPIVSIPKKPPTPSRLNLEKPLPPVPPPMPHFYNPLPPTAQVPEIRKSLPPPAPYIREPLPQPTPTYKNVLPPHSQRLVPSTAPPPMVKTPHFPPLAPTYKNPIPVPASTPHLKKPLPPVAPVPTYQKPTIPPPMHSRIIQTPNPPPVPTFKKSAPPPHPPAPVQQPNAPLHPPISPKPTTPTPSHSARPILQKTNTPPVPTFHKSVPSQAPVNTPISPTPMSHPSPKPAHKSAPSPLPTLNPAPPTKQSPSSPAPRRKSFYPIPKAPPIPQLPPVPTVPRRYFNLPKSRSRPSSPPS